MEKKHLVVEISNDFCALHEINGATIQSLGELVFTEKKEFQQKERLSEFLKEKVSDLSSYEEMSVSWISSRALLIPSSIFEPKEIKTLFSTCFTSQIEATELDYNRLSELSIVNIYEIPLWIKSFFVIRFPRVVIQHEYSMNLRGMMKTAFKLNVNVQVYPQMMTIQIVQRNEMLFCNAFEIQNENDVLYYLAFVMQQLNLVQEAGNLNFHLTQASQIIESELKSNINKIDTFKHLDVQFNSEKIIKFHQFCV